MQSKSASARKGFIEQSVIFSFFALLSLSACGLAMDADDRLARGEQALAEGDVRAAIIDAKDVLLDEPDNVRGRLLLGRASVVAGDGPAAEKELRRAVQLGTKKLDIIAELAQALILQRKFQKVLDEIPLTGLPSEKVEATVRRVHADAHMGLGNHEQARAMYTSALEIDSMNIDAQLGIVSSYIAEGNIAQAKGAVEQVIQSNADNPRAWLFSGSFNLQGRDFESARGNFQKAIELAAEQSDAHALLLARTGLAETQLEAQNVEEARNQLKVLQTEAPESFQTTLLAARIAYLDNDWTTAQRHLQQILRVAPEYSPAQMLLGAVHLRSGNLAQAEMHLSAAVASVPENVRTRQLLAETRLQMRKVEEAQEALAPIVGSDEADALSLQMAARASLSQRNVDDALQFLRRNVEENPDNMDFRFQLAVTLLEIGRTEEAESVLDGVDVSGSERAAYQRDVLRIIRAMRDGQNQAALRLTEQLTEEYSEQAGGHTLLGAVRLASNDVAGARSAFEFALNMDETSLLARRYLAAIAESEGDEDTARSIYAGMLEVDSTATWAHYQLGRLDLRAKNVSAAAERFQAAMDAEPRNPTYRMALARTENLRGNDAQAMLLLEKDMEATIAHVPSAALLAALKSKNDELDSALRISSRLIAEHPENPAAYALEGELRLLEGNLPFADQAYSKALSFGMNRTHVVRAYQIKRELGVADAEKPLIDYLDQRPLDNAMRAILAQNYMQSNELGKSISAYEKIVEQQPENAVALNNLAWAYFEVGNDRALPTARQAHELLPENGAIMDTLGWILTQTGSAEEGESLLRRAAELEDGRAEIRYHHAAALAKLGRREEAKSLLEKALATDEAFSGRIDAEQLLAEL